MSSSLDIRGYCSGSAGRHQTSLFSTYKYSGEKFTKALLCDCFFSGFTPVSESGVLALVSPFPLSEVFSLPPVTMAALLGEVGSLAWDLLCAVECPGGLAHYTASCGWRARAAGLGVRTAGLRSGDLRVDMAVQVSCRECRMGERGGASLAAPRPLLVSTRGPTVKQLTVKRLRAQALAARGGRPQAGTPGLSGAWTGCKSRLLLLLQTPLPVVATAKGSEPGKQGARCQAVILLWGQRGGWVLWSLSSLSAAPSTCPHCWASHSWAGPWACPPTPTPNSPAVSFTCLSSLSFRGPHGLFL